MDFLPAEVPDDPLILTIQLSSTRPAKRGKVLSSSSDEFFVLLSWLLLCSTTNNGKKGGSMPTEHRPFRVVGLRQESVSNVADGNKTTTKLRSIIVPTSSHQHIGDYLQSHTVADLATVMERAPSDSEQHVLTQNLERQSGSWSVQLSNIMRIERPEKDFDIDAERQPACSFFWCVPQDQETLPSGTANTEVTVSSFSSYWLQRPQAICAVISVAYSTGLCIAGLRLAYFQPSEPPHLIVALRGPSALQRWQEAVGPADVLLSHKTDPWSLHARHGDPADRQNSITYPRSQARAREMLVRWFGPRLRTAGGQQMKLDVSMLSGKHLLTTGKEQNMLIVLPPQLPAHCLAVVLAACQWFGFRVERLRRRLVGAEDLVLLEVTQPEQSRSLVCGRPAFLCQMVSESALLKAPFLKCLLVKELRALTTSGETSPNASLDGLMLDHLSTDAQKLLLGPPLRVNTLPSVKRFHSNPEMEQLACFVVTGPALSAAGDMLCGLLLSNEERQACRQGQSLAASGVSLTPVASPIELVGIRCLPSLTLRAVRDFIAEASGCHADSFEGAVLVVAVRGIDAFGCLSRLLRGRPNDASVQYSAACHGIPQGVFFPSTPAYALQLASMFFDHGHALVTDNCRRVNRHLLPADQTTPSRFVKVAPILNAWLSGPRPIASAVVLKPHISPADWCKILRQLAQNGFQVVGMRLVALGDDDVTRLETSTSGDEVSHVQMNCNHFCH